MVETLLSTSQNFQTVPAGTNWDSWLPSSTRDKCILLLRKCSKKTVMIIDQPSSYIEPSSNFCFTFQNLAFIFSHWTPALTVTPWVKALLSDQVAWKLTTTVKAYKGTTFTSNWKKLAAENFARIAKAVHSPVLVLFNEWQCNFWSCPGQLKKVWIKRRVKMFTRPVHKNIFLEFPKMPGGFVLPFDL